MDRTQAISPSLLCALLSATVGVATAASSKIADAPETPDPAELFSDWSAVAGIDFVHFNGMSGAFYYPEIVGPGGALFDYDNDGDLDIYLVQGQLLGPDTSPADTWFPPPPGQPLRDRLYRNDLVVHEDGRRTLQFTDVTEASRIDATQYGIGVAAGDYDNDGRTDLYVTNFGPNQLWRNNGDGTFSDYTHNAGVDEPRLSVSAAFLDYDQDGWLDLFVVNHVNFSFAGHKPCATPLRAKEYCATPMYQQVPPRLFRNRGDGSFEDVSSSSGIAREYGGGLGVVAADLNGDRWIDIYVANDGFPNQLWINQKDGTFQNEALMAGAAVNMDGAPEASMGVDAADFDGDGDEDLFMTHDLEETNTIYVNDGKGWFEDRSLGTGLGAPSQGFTAFGTAWFDYNNDGWLDLLIANGDVRTDPSRAGSKQRYPLDQKNQLFVNIGNGRFQETSRQAGTVFELSEVSRGAAFGDVDNDGDADVLIFNNSGPTRLLINHMGNRSQWLGLRLLDRSHRDALGCQVEIHRPSKPALWRRARADASYASANDPRILAGLGDDRSITRVRVYWPTGSVEEWTDLPTNRYTTLRQGKGTAVSASPGPRR